jgi:hypothetical protein
MAQLIGNYVTTEINTKVVLVCNCNIPNLQLAARWLLWNNYYVSSSIGELNDFFIFHWNNVFIEIQIDYKCKHTTQTIYNKKIPLSKQEVITKIMNHNNQILSSKHYFYILMFLFFLWKLNLSNNFFIPPYLFEICHMMIFNVTCEMRSITYTNIIMQKISRCSSFRLK